MSSANPAPPAATSSLSSPAAPSDSSSPPPTAVASSGSSALPSRPQYVPPPPGPIARLKMASFLKNTLARLTPNQSSASLANNGITTVKKADQLFTKTDPKVDGEDCDHDCATCTIKYPSKWSIDEHDNMYGHISGWSTHIIVATGKADWVRDVADEKGSVMEVIKKRKLEPSNGELMVSASNMPLPSGSLSSADPTTVILLPSFTMVDNVTAENTPELITNIISTGPTNTTLLKKATEPAEDGTDSTSVTPAPSAPSTPGLTVPTVSDEAEAKDRADALADDVAKLDVSKLVGSTLNPRPCPHKYLILLCSHKTRDARCGQSAPLLAKEFYRHLRPLGLCRDLHDERPGGAGIYFINHVGGHKFAANVIIYRKGEDGTATQGIWLARVRPEDCENIVRFTLLEGKLVKPDRQLRGGFDREKGLISW